MMMAAAWTLGPCRRCSHTSPLLLLLLVVVLLVAVLLALGLVLPCCRHQAPG
jgi:hypothetical protein